MDKFIRNFFSNHIRFFQSQLPSDEKTYDFNYSIATTDWRALKKEIHRYSLSPQTINDLEQLFRLAEDFTYSLKSFERYSVAISSLTSKWKEVQSFAGKFKISPYL